MTAFVVFGVSVSNIARAQQDDEGAALVNSVEDSLIANALTSVAPTPVLQSSGAERPSLYNNTLECTVNRKAITVGGATNPSPALSTLDYFSTNGGTISGFDLYLVNGGAPADRGGGSQPISVMQFYSGSNSGTIGTPIVNAIFRTIPQGGTILPSVPVHVDAVTGLPRMMRISVDYDEKTFTITDAETGEVLLDDFNEPILNADIGDRQRITLPPGDVGVLIRLGREHSICAVGQPKSGPVLAFGGSGNEDGMFIVGAESCITNQYSLLCDDAGWLPSIPCTGGEVCNLDRPHYGIRMVLYMGPSEDVNGNNELATADVINVGSPSPCVADLVTVHGFIGDNGQSSAINNAPCFDVDPEPDGNGELNLLDWRVLQICHGSAATGVCEKFDADGNGVVDLDDYETYQECTSNPNQAQCNTCTGAGPPVLLADVDLYRINNVSPGDVFEFLVEGDKSPVLGALWDPFLQVWAQTGGGLQLLEVSDDYIRYNLDAFTTIEVPQGVNTLYVGVSSAANAQYDPNDPNSIDPISASAAGGYALTVGVVDPDCVEDDEDGGPNDCYETKNEPDDSIADADANGGITNFIVRGMIGDGAFAEYGQDFDLYRIELTGPRANVRSLTARIPGIVGNGFDTVYDLVLALYDSDGILLATGDQKSSATQDGNDQSRPQLGANVRGDAIEGDGIYYLGVFATDREMWNSTCAFVFPPGPPSVLSFPHDASVAGTNLSDLRPFVGGRVNLPGQPIKGCVPDGSPDPAETQQCYRLNILTNPAPLANQQANDSCESAFEDGDDSLDTACTEIETADRLSAAPIELLWLGNGKFGGWQGDVDFHTIAPIPGQTVSVNVADLEQPPQVFTDHPIRSYLAFYERGGRVVDTMDYSLEHVDDTMFDGISDEIASNAATVMPSDIGTNIFAMVGIDSGNLLESENTPLDAAHAGTTLSRRFETDLFRQRRYAIGVTLLNPVASQANDLRVFATPLRGLDGQHVVCDLNRNNDGSTECFPPIVEIDPETGNVSQIISGRAFFNTYRRKSGPLFSDQDRTSSNPKIAYDGEILWVVVEQCSSATATCDNLNHTLFRIEPDNILPNDSSHIENLGFIESLTFKPDLSTGLVELDGWLYVLDAQKNETCMNNGTCNTLRFWDKTDFPASSNGDITIDLTELSGDGPDPDQEFDDLDGDLATDGTNIYIGCSFEDEPVGICSFTHDPVLNIVTFEGIIPDPITNLSDENNDGVPDLTPGPRLGGFDFVNASTIIASDANGPIVEYFNTVTDTVTGYKLPREFVIRRISARRQNSE